MSVAIKILADGSDCSVSDELLHESRIMASVDHPHCAELVGVCMTQPPQLITQFMPLGCLRDYLRARRGGGGHGVGSVGSGHLLLYSAQIASGMSYLERRGVLHRDLACRNVLVASPACVRITDFGLAKVVEDPGGLAEYTASGGKLPVKWLALESLLARRFSHKSDVWAYGVTLWEIFTFGEQPYPNVRPVELADYLEKGERLPQPPICTLDVYMIMIKCWMLNEQLRPGFDEMEASFRRMCSDPGRYVYIRGDRFARSLSCPAGCRCLDDNDDGSRRAASLLSNRSGGNANSNSGNSGNSNSGNSNSGSSNRDSYVNMAPEDYLKPIRIADSRQQQQHQQQRQQQLVHNPEYFFNNSRCC